MQIYNFTQRLQRSESHFVSLITSALHHCLRVCGCVGVGGGVCCGMCGCTCLFVFFVCWFVGLLGCLFVGVFVCLFVLDSCLSYDYFISVLLILL